MDDEVTIPSLEGPRSSRGLPQHDYVSPNLDVIIPDASFPNMRVGDTRIPQWTWLRKWVPHNWYIDKSLPYAGFASRDEVAIIYNTALKFRGRPCLEVGCWRGWSAVHFALGAGHLHVIDPILDNPEFAASISASCAAAGVLDKIEFHSGYSPGAIDSLSQKLGVKWSLMFIDAEHEGDAPRLDAEAALRNAAEDAVVLFHDLTSPFVAAALDRMREAGWRTMVYQTMQIMGVAWRGAVEPVRHTPDPNVFWTLPRHLSGYQVSGWERPERPHEGVAWWPGMTMEEQRNAAMLARQEREDVLVEEILTHEKTRNELQALQAQYSLSYQSLIESQQAVEHLVAAKSRSDGAQAAVLAQFRFTIDLLLEARLLNADLKRQQNNADGESTRLKHALMQEARALGDRARNLEAELTRQSEVREQVQQSLVTERGRITRFASQNAETDRLALDAARLRAVFGLFRRTSAERRVVLLQWARSLNLSAIGTDQLLGHFSRSRVILGLLRRSYREREALIARELMKFTYADLTIREEEQASILPLAAAPQALSSFSDANTDGYSHFLISLPMAWRLLSLGGGEEALGTLAPYFQDLDREDERLFAWIKAVPLGAEDDQALLRKSIMTICSSAYLDIEFYRRKAGITDERIDPALHYLLVGEAMGIPPSKRFDPLYYAQRNFDVVASGMSLLTHYSYYGQSEGRAPCAQEAVHEGTVAWDATKETVLIVSHEASRTGAPILAWNIAKSLVGRYNVVTVLIGGGALVPDFYSVSTHVCGPFSQSQRSQHDFRFAMADVFERHAFKYAIVNSTESRVLVEVLTDRLIPVVFLVHEFATYVYPRAELTKAFDQADELIFPAPVVFQSACSIHRRLVDRPIHLLPQGMSELPPPPKGGKEIAADDDMLKAVQLQKQNGVFIVLGAGTVSLRKGVDLFISIAASIVQNLDAPKMHFVWIGHGYRPSEDMGYSVYLFEQIARSGLSGHVTFLEETPDLNKIYSLADAFLLTSRLDPLPNVSIDSAWKGIPIVCFENASGMADLLSQDPITANGVVPHLDIEAASNALLRLAVNQTIHTRMSEATAAFAQRIFQMKSYVDALDAIGTKQTANARALREAAATITGHHGFSVDFFNGVRPCIESREEAVRRYVAAWHRRDRDSAWLRRPAPGFNAFAWQLHAANIGKDIGEPYAGFLLAGRPVGPWQTAVLPLIPLRKQKNLVWQRVAKAILHVHTDDMARFASLAEYLVSLEGLNVKLIVSAPESLRNALKQLLDEMAVAGAVIDLELRDALALANYIEAHADQFDQDFVAHLRATADQVVTSWSDFHWEHLLGRHLASIEQILTSFANIEDLGLVFPAEPYYPVQEDSLSKSLFPFAEKLSTDAMVEAVHDHPESGMFWARRDVTRRLAQMNFEETESGAADDEKISRLLPLVCQSAGLKVAVVTSKGVEW